MNLALTRGLTAYRPRVRVAPSLRLPGLTGERVSKILIVMLFSSMAIRLAADAAQTRHVTGILLVASEAMVVVLTVIRRPAGTVDRTVAARVLTGVSVFGPPLVQPASLSPLVPDWVTFMISSAGLIVVLLGKLSLGRSFGLAPANRGIVSTGLYRLVRHPIYMGYLVTHVGFVLANSVGWNLTILGTADIALLLRAIREERTLAGDPAYREYMQHVHWRVVPGIF